MKVVLYVLSAVLGLAVLVFLAQMIASETGEVVVLTTETADGPKETRLWVVELEEVQYLRAGPDSGWYQRLLAAPEVTLTRGGEAAGYRAEARPQAAAEVNRLMRAKYGWRDVVIEALVGGRDDAVAVALVPRT
ncbi:MAG: hypothetical protein AB7I04_04225 [Pseudomonadales bacterium]